MSKITLQEIIDNTPSCDAEGEPLTNVYHVTFADGDDVYVLIPHEPSGQALYRLVDLEPDNWQNHPHGLQANDVTIEAFAKDLARVGETTVLSIDEIDWAEMSEAAQS